MSPPLPFGALQCVKEQSLTSAVARKQSMHKAPPLTSAVHSTHDVKENEKCSSDVVSNRDPIELDIADLSKNWIMTDSRTSALRRRLKEVVKRSDDSVNKRDLVRKVCFQRDGQ
jgi:hypothetical protein